MADTEYQAVWVTPKTDWTDTDYFNIQDYNRIKGNLQYLEVLGKRLYPDLQLEEMGERKTYTDYLYADEINRIEENLERLREETYALVIGNMKVFEENGLFIDYQELNRIERACLRYFNHFISTIGNLRRLSFRLGGEKPFALSSDRKQSREVETRRLSFRLGNTEIKI